MSYLRPFSPASVSRLHRSLLVLLLLALTGGTPAPAPVSERLEQLLEADGANSAFWGIYVQDVASGEVIYAHNAEKAMLPASNQKLLTTAAMLDAFGNDYRYRTILYFDGDVDGSVLRGDLIIRGSGDPTFGSSELGGRGVNDPLRQWAQRLAEMGVTRIEGRIIADDNAFDEQPYAEGWDIDYIISQSSRSLGVSSSGLAYHDNVIEMKIESTSPGEAPSVTTRPADYLDIQSRATTSSRRRGWALKINRVVGTETIQMEGTLPRTYAGTIEMPVTNPALFTVHSFKAYLEEAGLEVPADVVDIDDITDLEQQPDYEEAQPLFVYLSPPITRIIDVLNKESNNFYAEQIFRTFGWGGSTGGGGRRVKNLLSRAGVETGALSIRDGSGLSRKNLITPEAMGKLLAYMYQHGEREAFVQSLAAGGEPQTTLRSRLGNIPVRAKTGSLEYVRALSGYADTPDGRTLAFAIFANNYTAPPYQITQTIDRVVMAITSLSAG